MNGEDGVIGGHGSPEKYDCERSMAAVPNGNDLMLMSWEVSTILAHAPAGLDEATEIS